MIIGDNLAEKLAKGLNLPFIKVKEVVFKDGEVKPILSRQEKSEKGIVLLQKKEKENINTYIIKYYLLLEKLSTFIKNLTVIIPYFPYARQDKVFQTGEPLSSLYLARLIEKNAFQIITFNFHEHRQKVENLFSKKIYNFSLFNFIKEKLKKENKISQNPLIIGPDEESKRFVLDFIQNDNFPFFIFQKKRDIKTNKVQFFYEKEKLKNLIKNYKEIIIVDDIISSGETIKKIQDIILSFKQKNKIKLVFIHPIYGDNTIKLLKKFGFSKIYTTNTIENQFYFLDFVDVLKEKAKNLNLF